MIKYVDYDIVFQEVPGEVSLALNISNCQFNCEGCHSPHLREDIGRDLEKDLPALLGKYAGMITCVLFLGEGYDRNTLIDLVSSVRAKGLKTAVYTGRNIPLGGSVYDLALTVGAPDYLKYGPYVGELGGLSSPKTNQRMYRWDSESVSYRDITHLFWKKGIKE